MSTYSWKERFLQLLWTGRLRKKGCTHVDSILDVKPSSNVCEECMAIGDVWVGLRMCAICGKVACCENSKNHHAKVHYADTGHPVIYSDPSNPAWCWCYENRTLVR